MKISHIIPVLMIMTTYSCNRLPSDPMKWDKEQLDKWFSEASWQGGWQVRPHSTVNKRSLAVQYFKNRKRWDQAFEFLKNTDLNSLPKGKAELDGQNLFYTIDFYLTKNMEDTRYESHQKYIDIQYVFAGEELMGITTTDQAQVTEPYNSEKDIIFYSSDKGIFARANPAEYLVFFPEDVHRPLIKVGDNAAAKKVVVKIKID